MNLWRNLCKCFYSVVATKVSELTPTDGPRLVGSPSTSGWIPPYIPRAEAAYSNNDITFFEFCFLNHVCNNGPQVLFGSDTPWDKPFRCDFSQAKLTELIGWIRSDWKTKHS